MGTNPNLQIAFGHVTGVEEDHEPVVHLKIHKLELVSVPAQKHMSGNYRSAFIAIHKRMVLKEALAERSSFFDDVFLITCLRPRNGRLQ